MFFKTLPAALAVASLAARAVVAQTPTRAEVGACAQTLLEVDYQEIYYFDVDDESHYFNMTYTYDTTSCTPRIPINEIRLLDESGNEFSLCTVTQFDATGTFYTQCPRTLGSLARASRDNDRLNWSLYLSLGVRPQTRGVESYFEIQQAEVSTPAPEPSGAFAKRRRDTQHVFDCPIGHTYCWTGQGQDYACMNTSSDVSACGQCPFAFGAEEADCTSIEGVDDVECRNSRCVVNACQRGFQISLDRTKCVDGRKRSHPARGLLF